MREPELENEQGKLNPQERQEFFDLIKAFQESSGSNDPDEVMAEVLEAQQAVRGGSSRPSGEFIPRRINPIN